jgi:hypothetical protein
MTIKEQRQRAKRHTIKKHNSRVGVSGSQSLDRSPDQGSSLPTGVTTVLPSPGNLLDNEHHLPEPAGAASQKLTRAVERRLREAVAAGLLEWSGQRFKPEMPTVTLQGGGTISDLLIQDRDR